MPPAKASRAAAGHDDGDSKPTNTKEKNGHGHTNGKMRRVASQNGSNLKDVTNAASLPTLATEASTANAAAANPSIQWSTFDRDFLHRYRRDHHLNTPTAYASDYRSWVMTQPGSVGLYSPTMARKKEERRQTRSQLTNTVRKHFNSQPCQENDVIVDFLHRVRKGRMSKLTGLPKPEKKLADHDRI